MCDLPQQTRIDAPFEPWLSSVGRVFREFQSPDSGCAGFGVEQGGARFFVKHSAEARGIASLHRAWAVNRAVRHATLPRLHTRIHTPEGLALVYDWVDGELLRHSGESDAADRFRSLPVAQAARAVDAIYDLHMAVAEARFVAVDLYDGCFIYDFACQRLWVCDLDEYRPGPFTLEADRLPGSTRFMAPEEFVRGEVIDQITNVYTLGRTGLILLGDRGGDPSAFRGTSAMKDVLFRASHSQRDVRQQSVREFVTEWRAACGGML